MRKRTSLAFLIPVLSAALSAAPQSPPEDPVFRAGTRLVEIEVVVRNPPFREPGLIGVLKQILDQAGPPYGPPGVLANGLRKDDFTVLDQGKPQPIDVFRNGFTSESTGDARPLSLPPGAVSNRLDIRGKPLNGATAVLVDLLDTPFLDTEYARMGFKELLRSLSRSDSRIAIYSLGRNLHTLHDFDDDPQQLGEMAAAWDQPHSRLPAEIALAFRDYGDVQGLEGGAETAADVHGRIASRALSRIVQRLSGMPGRKSLIWLAEISTLPPSIVAMIQRANIVLYPVMVRCPPPGLAPCGFAMLESEYATRDLGSATGGRGFFDARDLTFALQAAQEDSGSAYVLGYYPAEAMLDGKYHDVTVKLRNNNLVLHYRSGYLATKAAIPSPGPTPDALYAGRADSARIGLSAQFTPEALRAGFYDLRLTVDLRDIHLDRKDGRFTGALELSIPNPSVRNTVSTAAVAVDLTDREFPEALRNGIPVSVTGAQPENGQIRVVVRDRATGIAGSLRIPVTKP